ncbi:MAG: DegT/DnrJ/EryC1/StrS family aminotransferase, partial [bacterium]|nr:DegT/DnrJ/EryC1/StrS family aminotransferase [bacterium]
TGEGGAVLTNDRVFHEKLLLFRAHGITKDCFANEPDGDWYYEMKFLGYNYRMNDIQAALGLSQLKKLDGFTARRREIGAMYDTIFAGNPYFHLPAKQDDVLSAFHLYPIRLKDAFIDRKKVIFSQLRTRGLGVQVHYIPAYLHPFYHDRGYRPGLCPRAERFYCQEISLPLFPSMTSEMVRIVVETVQEVFDGI